MSVVLGKYEFLGDMDTFLYLETQLDNENKEEPEAKFCNSLKHKPENKTQLINTCKRFVTLFKLSKNQCDNKFSTDGRKYIEFMN
ncbi:hypothetical protein PVPAM_060007800 [Plasmodium vivax]|nr:hypothetical protein PVPAM_060007800 [Plasmodium vivax]